MTATAQLLAPKPLNVLLIEDSDQDAWITEDMMLHGMDTNASRQLHLTRSRRLLEALQIIEERPVDAVVLDLSLPDGRGPDSILKINRLNPAMPIVVLSGQADEVNALRALEYGAQEFLVKGECTGLMIRQSIYNAIFRKSLHRKG